MRIAFRFVMCFAGIFFLALVVLVSFVIGGLMAEQNCYARYYSDRKSKTGQDSLIFIASSCA